MMMMIMTMMIMMRIYDDYKNKHRGLTLPSQIQEQRSRAAVQNAQVKRVTVWGLGFGVWGLGFWV